MPIIPVVRSSAILRSIAFYTEVLDFRLVGVWPEPADPGFSILTRNGDELHLSSHGGDGAYGQSITVLVDEVDELFARFKARGLDGSHKLDSPIHQGPTDQTWGTREFCVDDPDGNRLCFTRR
ncbi:VOC family protein [Brevundimonas sp.]|uniref:bleomycin resistance protein n=1 Tax=Brevundimonas sp. TaxID=1871086 RepID=UPI0026333912|nr:VOC family protein [Brevundimonas sp.]